MEINFYINSVSKAGAEIALINLVKKLYSKEMKINLFVRYKFQIEIFDAIKSLCSIDYVLDDKLYNQLKDVRKKKKNFIYKIKYNYLMFLERNLVVYKLKKRIKEESIILDFKLDLNKKINFFKNYIVIGWLHSSVNGRKKSSVIRFIKRIKKYNKIIAISDSLKEELESYRQIHNIRMIYNVLDKSEIIKKSVDYSKISNNEIKLINDRYVVVVGRLCQMKGLMGILEAYNNIKDELKYRLIFIGEGDLKNEMEGFISKNNLKDKVFLLGNKDNPYPWIKNASLLLSNSLHEGLSLVIIEAMMLDIPIISTDCPVGTREALDNGRYGQLIPVNSIDELTKALKDFNEDSKKYDNYVKLFSESLKRFDGNRVSEEIYNLIKEFKID